VDGERRPVKFGVGDFLGVLIDFLIIGFVVWRISKAFIKPSPTAPVRTVPSATVGRHGCYALPALHQPVDGRININ